MLWRRTLQLKMEDELWVGVKGQSNSVIAGSPEKCIGCSVLCFLLEVELLDGRWALSGY